MDGVRFDTLARALGARTTRRIALGIIPLFGLGNVLGDTAAKKKKKKSKRCPASKKKCNRKCIPKNDCCQNANCREGEVCHQGTCCLPNCLFDGSYKVCGDDGCGGSCGPCHLGECEEPSGRCRCLFGNDCGGGVCCPNGQVCGSIGACGSCPVGSNICSNIPCGVTANGGSCGCVTTTDGPACMSRMVCADCQTAEDCAAVLDRPVADVGCMRNIACTVCPSTGNAGCVVKGCQDA
jgi:hypothetical protein